MPNPLTQSTVSIWTNLKPKLLEYCNLLNIKTSELVNGILAEAFDKIEAQQANLPFIYIDRLRRRLGKDQDLRLSETIYQHYAGIDPVAEGVKQSAGDNASRTVPLLLRAKRRGWSSAKACQVVCGCVETDLTRQLAILYESSLTSEAAQARAGSSTPPAIARLYGETYQIFLRHAIALAIAREIPPRFQSLVE